MKIKWFGQACFQIKTREGIIITDPYDDEIGWSLPQLQADILTISHDHFDHNARDKIQAKRIFDAPGEYEVGGVSILGILADHDQAGGSQRGKVTMFRFILDGISILHSGDLGTKLSDDQIDEIGTVDVVLLPVGGTYTIDAGEAAEVVKALDPKIVIPMHYRLPGLKVDISEADDFISKIGLTPESVDSLDVSRLSLPEDGMRLVVLDRIGARESVGS